MAEEHPNIALFKGMNPSDLPNATDLFAPNAVFHYINPRLPDIHGDYVGMEGIRSFLTTGRDRVDLAVNLMGVNLGRLDYFSLSRVRCDITCQIAEDENTPTMFGEAGSRMIEPSRRRVGRLRPLLGNRGAAG